MKKRSDYLAMSKTILQGTGRIDEELKRPYVGIASTWTEHFAGHNHLDKLAEAVSDGVYMAGGTPCIFGTIAIADCTSQESPEQAGDEKIPNASLPSRDLICDSVEAMAYGCKFDALVLIAGCDKIIPAMLMAAGRLNIPTIVLTGGPMLPLRFRGVSYDTMAARKAAQAGTLSEMEYDRICDNCSTGSGSCCGMYTANSMSCISEIIGMGLPGNGTIPAVYAERTRLAKLAGMQVMELYRQNIRPRDIMTREAFENAIRVDMMMGGSNNTVIHLLAMAHEVGVPLSIDDFAHFSRITPEVCKIQPCGPHYIVDLYEAGGVQALMKRAEEAGVLHTDCLTVTGHTVADNIKDSAVLDDTVIRPLDHPYDEIGGLGVLRGNIAPDGAIVKSAGVPKSMWRFRGPAVCFDGEDAAFAGIKNGAIKPGDVVVLRYKGPKGGPGMPEMANMGMMLQATFGGAVALVTDGRFSGFNDGPLIGYVCPEAAVGGPIALIEDGDMIEYDIEKESLMVDVSDGVLAERRKKWAKPQPKFTTGFMAKYIALVGPSSKGALVDPFNNGQ